jgi:hypothetical protein
MPDEKIPESPVAAAARKARELPPDWRDHWASEAAALAALDSAAPASAAGETKYNADGPSMHAMQHAPVGSESADLAADKAAAGEPVAGTPGADAAEQAATDKAAESRSESRSEERKTDRK